jgi:hypothetical protein
MHVTVENIMGERLTFLLVHCAGYHMHVESIRRAGSGEELGTSDFQRHLKN